MRLALIIYGSLDTISGGYLYDRKLVAALQRRGDTVEIISLPWRSYARHLGDNFSPALYQRLAGLEVDFLLQDELNHPSLFGLNRRLRGKVTYPILSIVHHLRSSEARPAWQNGLYRWVERRYLSGVDGFIFNSQTTRKTVESMIRPGRPSFVATPAGDRLGPRITAEEISDRARKPGPLRLLFLGNLIPRKGLHTLLEAVDRIPKELWTLAVAGSVELDPAYTREIRRQAAAGRLDDRVRFLGPLQDARLAHVLENSHLLVVPSSYEGYGIAYLEGMGFGLPAIGTTTGAAGEIITHGQDGFLVGPGDSAALAEYLELLARDRNCLVKMSRAARQRYQAQPTWEQSMERVVEFLH